MANVIYGTVRLEKKAGLTDFEDKLSQWKEWTKEKAKERRQLKPNLRALSLKNASAAYARKGRLAKYGLDEGKYRKLLISQDSKCAICKREPRKRRLSVDHDHATQKVRGLLCFKCNKYWVGAHTLQSIQQVMDYLTNPPADKVLEEVKKV